MSRSGKSTSPIRKQCDKNSTFNKGSNIPGLSDEAITETPQPKLPARRVRDLGKEILARANRSTWFEHMVRDNPPKEIEETKASEQEKCEVEGTIDNEDQLKALKNLEEQQLELMKQQKNLHEQIGLQLKLHRSQNTKEDDAYDNLETFSLQDLTSTSPSLDDSKTTALISPSKHGSCQRRLKGDIARLCAKRDEGCIKSLIWYQDDGSMKGLSEEHEKEASNELSNHTLTNANTGSKTRLGYTQKADSSLEVQELLSNKYSPQPQ